MSTTRQYLVSEMDTRPQARPGTDGNTRLYELTLLARQLPPGYAMTLTFALTVLAVWFVVSVPAALVIASMMRPRV